MTIGGSIAVIAVGAALTFAVTVNPPGLNLDALGVILMLAGAVTLFLRLRMQRIRTVRHVPVVDDALVEEPVTVEEEPPPVGDED